MSKIVFLSFFVTLLVTTSSFAFPDKNNIAQQQTISPVNLQAPCATAHFVYDYFYAAGVVRFFDKSTHDTGSIVSWAWDFGDGTTSTKQNPEQFYATEGSYLVKLVVTDETGCSVEFSQQVEWKYP